MNPNDQETTLQEAVILRDSQSNELVIVPHHDKLGIRVVRGSDELSFYLSYEQITTLINKLETYRLSIRCAVSTTPSSAPTAP
jgi:hypothetical protein